MKKKISLVFATLLFSCTFIFAQNGGIPVELKPYKPPNKPPFGNVIHPHNTDIIIKGLLFTEEKLIFDIISNNSSSSWTDENGINQTKAPDGYNIFQTAGFVKFSVTKRQYQQ